jgi:nicotinamidase-related amidase
MHGAAVGLAASPTVLLLVDFINPLDFDGADALAPSALAAARATARLRREAARSGVQTLYANDNYGVWRSDFKALWSRCRASRGAAGTIARLMKPRREDLAILKPRHSAFYGTPLELFLHDLDVKRLVLAGIAADSCVLMTACDAHVRGFDVHVPADCVASPDPDDARQALELLARTASADLAHGERVAWARGH